MQAVILLSGGIDSTVALAIAHAAGRKCLGLSFDYGQRNKRELKSAELIAAHYQIPQYLIKIDLPSLSQSALVNQDLAVLQKRTKAQIAAGGIPNTYVPARNTLFLAYAASFAEMHSASEIYFGANALDCGPYPDCQPAYLQAFQGVLNVATKQAIEGAPPRLVTPLLYLDKSAIVAEGMRLKAPLELTFSCYSPARDDTACHQCDACTLRQGLIF